MASASCRWSGAVVSPRRSIGPAAAPPVLEGGTGRLASGAQALDQPVSRTRGLGARRRPARPIFSRCDAVKPLPAASGRCRFRPVCSRSRLSIATEQTIAFLRSIALLGPTESATLLGCPRNAGALPGKLGRVRCALRSRVPGRHGFDPGTEFRRRKGIDRERVSNTSLLEPSVRRNRRTISGATATAAEACR